MIDHVTASAAAAQTSSCPCAAPSPAARSAPSVSRFTCEFVSNCLSSHALSSSARPAKNLSSSGPYPPAGTARAACRQAVVRVAAEGGWKSMNVTKPNLVQNLDGQTTRNIDGKVYTITVEGDGVTVKDKFGQMFSARVNSSAIVEADLENSVAGASSMSVGGMNFAISPEQVTGMKGYTELINGRAAMVGIVAAMGAELTGHSVASQVFSPGGFLSLLLINAATIAASVAPVALNKVTLEKCFPSEKGKYGDELLPTFWTPVAEKLNGRVAMVAFALMLVFGQ
eukprot:CAMPEP_0197577740 /NCGR_PEP_ID=MMETSP1326-20131121/2252_1 /TAXON_ID=1155430 /ORGANISM="Genus nov. species nov., Strain RCC2288" /LENGTH=283 /DNA_ID=CAMNT_0043140845 /DNA_START=309 /DNA_END=1159 /DNA_ORIENTATION=-